MSVQDWQKIKDVFALALEQPGERRADFLREACAGDFALREEVESLLEAYSQPEPLIERDAYSAASIFNRDGKGYEGKEVGHYKIIREIGRGGMGSVYLGERADAQYRKFVAIKVVRRGMDSEDIMRRFRNERQILAGLDHPNIARLLDGGTTEDGLPYLVMEYVEGVPVTDYCDRQRLTTNERLELFRRICEAVQHAHQNLVVHRDLKPSNILITPDGTPKLLDFGIAKVLNPELSALSMEHTRTELRVLTPDYASPEQLRGEKLTTATDVYSLGVVLYELLTGHRPYRATNAPPHELTRVVCEQEPTKPSTAVSRVEVIKRGETEPQTSITPESVSRARDTQPDKLRRRLSGDLDNIVLMALRKEPRRRYESAAQLADDIRRQLEGLPVVARKDTFKYRAEKFVARNKILVLAVSLILLSLFAGVAATAWQARKAAAERDRAQLEAAKATRINAFLQKMLLAANPNWNAPGFGRNRDVTLIEVIDEAAQQARTEFADQPEVLATIQHNIGITYLFRGRYAAAESNLRVAFETSRQLYGEEHPETVQNMRDLAGSLMLKGDYEQAASLYQNALVIYRKRLAEGRTEGNTLLGFAGTLNDVGLLFRLKGEPQIAESFLREALETSTKFTGNERAVMAIVLNHLGAALDDQGNLGEAEKIARQAIDEFRRLPGNQRSEFGGALINLGNILKAKGDYGQAETHMLEGLNIYRRLLGDAHPYTAAALSHLADLQYLKGDYAAAEETAEQSLQLARQSLGEEHPHLAYPLTALGLILTKTGQPAGGETFLREALEIRRRVMKEGFWRIAETEGALGEVFLNQKRFAEAEPLLLESYEKLKLSQATENTRTLSAKRRLVELYTAWNKPELLAQYQ